MSAGAVIGASEADQGVCTCFEGAYGIACEFMRCPHNCSAADAAMDGTPAEDLKRGTCDRFTGTCLCGDGYSGLDCSGTYDLKVN